MIKRVCFAVLACVLVLLGASPAFACGGLIGPNGAVNLTRTTTLAAHHDGVEHYITAFKYAGGGGEFGSIVPLPAMPTKVEKGGDWTLQRLLKETAPPQPAFGRLESASAGSAAVEVYKTKIDALDITVLKGGGRSVGIWASEHGFRLPPDTPEVLDFYAMRSPYFLAAVFDSEAAAKRGQSIGDGTPIHITMPMKDAWVPLRILGLGKQAQEVIQADVYLLTDLAPKLLPLAGQGYTVERQVLASQKLLDDLRSDRGMGWLPRFGMMLTHIVIDAAPTQLTYDLAVSTRGAPSRELAGLPPLPTPKPTIAPTPSPTPEPTPAATVIAAAPVDDRTSMPLLVVAALLVCVAVLGAWKGRAKA